MITEPRDGPRDTFHTYLTKKGLTFLGLCLAITSSLPETSVAAASDARLKRVIEHWTPARKASAIPRDFVLDRAGDAYIKLPNGGLQPYGNSRLSRLKGKPTSGDSNPPTIEQMSPNGTTIGSQSLFGAVVTDDESSLKSVSFTVKKGANGIPQSFQPQNTSGNVWEIILQGFTDGEWQWQIDARDNAAGGGNSATSDWAFFTVDTTGGSVDTGGGDNTDPSDGTVITNGHWNYTDDVMKRATGRIYFEMPANKRGTRWNGYVCSGTVTADNNVNYDLVITAAHCLYDDVNKTFARNVLFIPDQDRTSGSGTDTNCSNDPMGCWSPEFAVVDVEWTNKTFPENIPWDYGFYAIAKTGDGVYQGGFESTDRVLTAATGQVQVNYGSYTYGYDHALGYSYAEDPLLRYCAEMVEEEATYNDLWMSQCGMSGGASGGPWVTEAQTSPQIFSVNSWGYTTQPGMAGPRLGGALALRECALADTPVISEGGIIVTNSSCQ